MCIRDRGGFGSAVLEWMNLHGKTNPLLRLGVPDRFLTHATRAQWLEELHLNADGVAASIQAFVEENH